MGKRELHSSGFEMEQQAVSCEHNNNISGSKKCGKFLDQLRNYLLLKTVSAPTSYSSLVTLGKERKN
jgi:hypothetical protein